MAVTAMPSSTISPIEVMKTVKTIAVVGASKNPEKEAHSVPLFLKENGYRIIPINPTAPEIFGEKAFPDLLSLPPEVAVQVEAIEVFRPSDELPAVASQVVELAKRHDKRYVFWAQLGLENDEAKRILDEAGIPYVMGACMRVVHSIWGDRHHSLEKLIEPVTGLFARREPVTTERARYALVLSAQREPLASGAPHLGLFVRVGQ
jgi:predicted CoA-binding protein